MSVVRRNGPRQSPRTHVVRAESTARRASCDQPSTGSQCTRICGEPSSGSTMRTSCVGRIHTPVPFEARREVDDPERVPSGLSKVVSSTFVFRGIAGAGRTVWRADAGIGRRPDRAACRTPARRRSGEQHQTTSPLRWTSAANWQLPMRPMSSSFIVPAGASRSAANVGPDAWQPEDRADCGAEKRTGCKFPQGFSGPSGDSPSRPD